MSDIIERAQRWMREFSTDVRIRVCLEDCVNEIERLQQRIVVERETCDREIAYLKTLIAEALDEIQRMKLEPVK